MVQIQQGLSTAQKRVFDSMVELLARAGLDYQGDCGARSAHARTGRSPGSIVI